MRLPGSPHRNIRHTKETVLSWVPLQLAGLAGVIYRHTGGRHFDVAKMQLDQLVRTVVEMTRSTMAFARPCLDLEKVATLARASAHEQVIALRMQPHDLAPSPAVSSKTELEEMPKSHYAQEGRPATSCRLCPTIPGIVGAALSPGIRLLLTSSMAKPISPRSPGLHNWAPEGKPAWRLSG